MSNEKTKVAKLIFPEISAYTSPNRRTNTRPEPIKSNQITARGCKEQFMVSLKAFLPPRQNSPLNIRLD